VDAEVRVVATEFLRLRPILVAPFLALTVGVLAIGGTNLRQPIALGCIGGIVVGYFFYERRLGAKLLVDSAAFRRSLLYTICGITIACVLTGATASPILPMFFAPVGVGFAAFGKTRSSLVLFLAL